MGAHDSREAAPRSVSAAGGLYDLKGKITRGRYDRAFRFRRVPVDVAAPHRGAADHAKEVANGLFSRGTADGVCQGQSLGGHPKGKKRSARSTP
jgi:hypothetical protein